MLDGKLNFSGGLNQDDSEYAVPANAYTDALNITRKASGKDKIIANIVGNREVTFSYPSGVSKVIGSFPFLLRNTVIFFRWNENGYHGVYEYNHSTGIIEKVFENLTDSGGIDVLGFTRDNKITGVDIFAREEGDLLFFLDSLGRPTQMDIKLFKAGEYTPVTRDILDKCKKPPLLPPSVLYANDGSIQSNDLQKRLFRFKYRYVYDDFEKSVFSPISRVPLPVNILDDTFTNIVTNNNVIQVGLNSGDKNVKKVELAVSFVNGTNEWSDFAQVDVIKKESLAIVADVKFDDSTGLASIGFSGNLIGVVINVYLTQLPNTKVLIGTYTTIAGDTPNSIAYKLLLDIVAKGKAIYVVANGAYVKFYYTFATYKFDEVELLNNDVVDNAGFTYQFYNDSTYPNVNIGESIQLFDYVPDKAVAQALLNGNVLGYANITEGYDKDTVESALITIGTIAATNSTGGGTLNAVFIQSDAIDKNRITIYTFSGLPAVGTVVSVKARRKDTSAIQVIKSYTTVLGDTYTSVINKLTGSGGAYSISIIHSDSIFVNVNSDTYIPISGILFATVDIVPPNVSSAYNSVATWKPSTSRKIARQYFDQHGKTNGVLYYDKVVFPAYAENGSNIPLLPYINYKIYDIPPIWAYSFGFLVNKIATTWIYWLTNKVIIPSEDYIYFDVTDFLTNAIRFPTTAKVLSYNFKDGDRMRIIRDADANTVAGATYDTPILGLITDPKIDGLVTTPAGRQFIKIKKITSFTSYLNITHNYVIELYTPTQQLADDKNESYYEIGRQYLISNPTLPNRAHTGEVSNQDEDTPAEFNFYEGDAYFRSRPIAISDASVQTFNAFDTNFVDSYSSSVSSIDGRPSIIDQDARKQTFPTLIRFGQAYQADTNVNGLSRFYGLNFDEYDYTFGEVTRLKVRDRMLKVFQMFKIGVVPLFGQLMKDASGTLSLTNTDKLLNPIQYRTGNIGLSAPESLASYRFADYGCDKNLGIIWRDSNDGINSISTLYKMDTWAKEELPLRVDKSHIYGAFYPDTDLYVIALEQSPVSCAEIAQVIGNTVATPIVCATISAVIGYTENSSIACGAISVVNGYTSKTFGAGITVKNQHTEDGNYIYSLSPDSWVSIVGYPVNPDGEATGTHNDFSGSLTVSCSVSSDSRVEIYKNAVFLDCNGHIGTGAQSYTISGLTILETDIIEIRLVAGDTCP